MAKARRFFVCRQCGAETSGWAGRCPQCDAWATVEEVSEPVRDRAVRGAGPPVDLRSLAEVDRAGSVPSPTGVDEIDRVLGGGLTPGSVTLLGGEPGVGKSTLTLQMAVTVAGGGASVLLFAGEEAPSQIAARAARLGEVPKSLSVLEDSGVDAIIAGLESTRPQVAVIDSIQTVRVHDVEGSPGSVGQLKAATERLITAAQRLAVSIVLVGHVTKEGVLAGPRVIEHMVDTVLTFGGDRSSQLRYLRAVKHRFGPTSEVGIFEMTAGGLAAVSDPSGRFLLDRQPGLTGSVVVPTLEGRRTVLVEIQALTVNMSSNSGQVRVQGVDARRLAMICAVMGRRAGCSVGRADLFVSSTGGAAVTESGADLGMAIALASSMQDRVVSPDLVACGEIGLGGELRSVPQLGSRLQEAYRMGFRAAIVPQSAPEGPTGLSVIRVSTLADALSAVTRRAVP